MVMKGLLRRLIGWDEMVERVEAEVSALASYVDVVEWPVGVSCYISGNFKNDEPGVKVEAALIGREIHLWYILPREACDDDGDDLYFVLTERPWADSGYAGLNGIVKGVAFMRSEQLNSEAIGLAYWDQGRIKMRWGYGDRNLAGPTVFTDALEKPAHWPIRNEYGVHGYLRIPVL